MKKIFKISMMLLVGSMLLVTFQGCKKDKKSSGSGGGSSQTNQLLYEGQTYAITQGGLYHYGSESGSDYNIDLELWWESNDGESVHYIYFEMFSATDELISGKYNFSNTTTAFTFDYGEFGFYKAGSYEIEREVVAGSAIINKTNNTYTITINCKDENGKAITGYFSGVLEVVYEKR